MPIDDNKVNYFNLITIASIEDQNINKNEFKLSKLVNKECSSCHKISKELKKEVLNPEKYKLNTIKITLYD
jgi:cytochrome c2